MCWTFVSGSDCCNFGKTLAPPKQMLLLLTLAFLLRTFVRAAAAPFKMVIPPGSRCCFCLTLQKTFVSGDGCWNSVKMVVRCSASVTPYLSLQDFVSGDGCWNLSRLRLAVLFPSHPCLFLHGICGVVRRLPFPLPPWNLFILLLLTIQDICDQWGLLQMLLLSHPPLSLQDICERWGLL